MLCSQSKICNVHSVLQSFWGAGSPRCFTNCVTCAKLKALERSKVEMLRAVAKPFTGLQMTQLGGELQGLFAPRSNLHFYPEASVQPVLPVPPYCSYCCPSRADPAVWPGSVPNSSRCGFIAKICESAGARNWQPGRNRHLQARNMHVSVRGNPTGSRNKDLVRTQITGFVQFHVNETSVGLYTPLLLKIQIYLL